jgi:hypothetical protein
MTRVSDMINLVFISPPFCFRFSFFSPCSLGYFDHEVSDGIADVFINHNDSGSGKYAQQSEKWGCFFHIFKKPHHPLKAFR